LRAISCEGRIGPTRTATSARSFHEVDDLVGKDDVQSDFRMDCREPRYQRQQAMQSERDVAIDPHEPARNSSSSYRPLGLV
jgi:hypothetical protein